MKRFYNILSFGLLALMLVCCIEDKDITDELHNGGSPVFDESSFVAFNKTASSVEITAELVKENGAEVTERGFCYSLLPSPTTSNSVKVDSNKGIGSYTLKIDGLIKDTTYYIRPYAINSQGPTYGSTDIVVKTNNGLGMVKTVKPADVHATTAKTGGQILDLGEGVVNSRGIYYSLTKDFQSKTKIESTEATDTYYCDLTGLLPSTLYYVMAYVENTYGEFVGSIDSLKTPDGLPRMGIITLTNTGFTDVSISSAVSESGDADVTERGLCWGVGTDTLPAIENGNTVVCGSGTGLFSGTIDGLTSKIQYYVRSYAKNSFGVVYSDVIKFYTKDNTPTVQTDDVVNIQNGNATVKGTLLNEGMTAVTATGICWSMTNNTPTLSDSVMVLPVGIGNVFIGQLAKLVGGKTYYVRAYATNSEGTAYGEVKQFTVDPIFNTNFAAFPGTSRIANSTAYFSVGDALFMYGGDLGPNYTDELWSYSITDKEWKQMKSSSNSAKWQTAISYGAGAFVLGGLGDDGKAKNSLTFYYKTTNLWHDPSTYPSCPDSSYLAVGYASGSTLYYIGGRNDTLKSNVWSFQVGMDVWTQKTSFPVKQYGGVAAVVNGTAYVGMGKDASDVCNGKLWETSDDCATWNLKTQCTIFNGGIFAGVVCNDRIYVIDEAYYILEYNPETDVWTKKSQLPTGYQSFHCMYSVNGLIYIGLGSSNSLISYNPLLDN